MNKRGGVIRDLYSGEDKVAKLQNDAQLAGYDVIELLWNKIRKSPARVTDYETLKIQRGRAKGGNAFQSMEGNTILVKEQVWFYPDGSGYCYGYVVDTPNNRKKIAQSMSRGWFRVTDGRIRKEIEELAKELGISTDKVTKPQLNVRVTPREKKAMTEAERLKKQVEELKAELEEGRKNGVVKKPLEGVKIKPKKREELTNKADKEEKDS